MDTHALLTSQGWRGSGHSLHPTSDQSGLSRPLLVSRKQNNLGVGKKQHKTSDMWWMNAFDQSLKGLDTAQDGKVVQTLTSGGLDMVAKGGSKFVGNGGLYASFVRGESLSGTITPEDSQGIQPGTKRKRAKVRNQTKEERRARKEEARRAARAHRLLAAEPAAPTPTVEPAHINGEEKEEIVKEAEKKEQRRERRIQKKLMGQAEIDGRGGATSNVKKKRRKE